MSKEEDLINFLSTRLSQANKENVVLKAKGKFNCQQAENTMRRLTEDIGSYVIKKVIRK